jgi:hypothetical protein
MIISLSFTEIPFNGEDQPDLDAAPMSVTAAGS